VVKINETTDVRCICRSLFIDHLSSSPINSTKQFVANLLCPFDFDLNSDSNLIQALTLKMGIHKQYLRYVKDGDSFGGIGSAQVDLQFVVIDNVTDRFVATASAEDVLVWDTKTNQIHLRLPGQLAHVTAFTFSAASGQPLVAIGYTDGRVRVFDYTSLQCKCTFVGHKSAVNSIAFSSSGLQLASGGADCEIVVWDIANEAGVFRLRGHRGAITKVAFMANREHLLVSSSKDTFVKFWDLRTQHCFKTLFGHKTEVWDFVLFKRDKRIVTGSNDLRVFKIRFNEAADGDEHDETDDETELVDQTLLFDDEEEKQIQQEDQAESPLTIEFMGNILRASSTRLMHLTVDENERLLTCNGNDSFAECFKLRTVDEIRTHFTKKMRKMKRKLQQNSSVETSVDTNDQLQHIKIGIKDEFERLDVIKVGKPLLRRTSVHSNKFGAFRIACLLNNNSFEVYSYEASDPRAGAPAEEASTTSRTAQVEQAGHRAPIIAIAVSSDGRVLVSVSRESVKVWNRLSHSCFCTITQGVETPTSVVFAPGDRFVLIGTKKGNVQILNIGSGEIVETISVCPAGTPVSALYLYPDEKGVATGGQDRLVKFWDFDLVQDRTGRRLTLNFDRELATDDAIVCLRISEDMKFLAVSLLDSTVRVFYLDTLRFFLSLYGHKFPVNCMDIASDGSIIATGSADKNVKIWGMDFGDCHKSIFAHDESITELRFVPKTHYFFTSSRDGKIKQWDADVYDKVLTLQGHESEVTALAIGDDGQFLLSAGRDQTLRLWNRTEEIVVVDDELETEREAQFEKDQFATEENVVPGERNTETGLPSYKTGETLRATERLIEAIDLYQLELLKLADHKSATEAALLNDKPAPPMPQPHVLFALHKTRCPDRYMLEVLRTIKSAELEECMLCLPFDYVVQLLPILNTLLERNWEIELLCRTAGFLVRLHIGQIIANHSLAAEVRRLRDLSTAKVTALRDLSGYNLAAVNHAQSKVAAESELTLFQKAFNDRKDKRKKSIKEKPSDAVCMISMR
jgi:U3 small nucleolar RNA-associated protein 12